MSDIPGRQGGCGRLSNGCTATAADTVSPWQSRLVPKALRQLWAGS
jgi:hypothetical protein